MRKLLIAVLILAVVLVAGDRIAVAVAENQVSSRIATAYDLPARPTVTIQGFPFLTQAVAGDYREIDITAARVSANGVTLTDLRARFTGVHEPLSQVLGHGAASVTADRAVGSAIVGFGELSRRLPSGLKLTAHGKDVTVSGTVSYDGVRIPLSATVAIGVTASGIKVTAQDVRVSGGLTLPASLVGGRLSFVVPLQTLPFHLHLTSVSVTPGGVRVGASARNVYFARA